MVRTHPAGALRPHVRGDSRPNVPLAEHALVRLLAPVTLDDGRRLPSGARGAVVLVHGEGVAYEVEFIAPFHAVIAISATDLSPADGA